MSKIEISDEQLQEMYERSYEEIQKQWKEMTESLTSQAKPREGESVQHRDYLTNLIMNTRVGFPLACLLPDASEAVHAD